MNHPDFKALVLVIATLLPTEVMAMIVQHTLDWDFAPYPSYYSDWATTKNFIAGEKLIFSYDPTIHNVQQVRLSDYTACNATHAIQDYETGEDVILFTKAGIYYFICGVTGHCSQAGMLMKVQVGPGPESLPPPPNHPPPPPPHLPPPPPPHSPPPPRPRHPPPPPPTSPPPPLSPPSESPLPAPSPLSQAHSPFATGTPSLPPSSPTSPPTPPSPSATGLQFSFMQIFLQNESIRIPASEIAASRATVPQAPAPAPSKSDAPPSATVGMNVAVSVILAIAVIL